ncbi:PPE family protein [Mycobacterium sp. M1]|uniref:PPE family protein n=1 Tax=Mycolicibacter acidiphilus TaxID=2835306 RepID=A0ABS5RHE1_9MYCO|nr:PPE family protein [Mycolicibacter acidiphilus]
MDFGTVPPEIVSGRIYAGPGAESMVAAATAWESLAAELSAAASAYGAVVTGLTDDGWAGPSSAAMAAAATPFVTWMGNAAVAAKQASVQAATAASAFEAALAAVVPPPVIAANRSLRASLVASNVFGQHIAAIAAADAQYLQMWAQDAAAMYGYAAASAAATRLAAFSAPPQTTNPAGQAASAAAAGNATATTAGSSVQSMVPQLLQALGLGGAQSAGVAGAGTAGSSSIGDGLAALYTNLFGTVANVVKFDGIGNAAMSVPNFGMVEFKTFFKPLSLLPDIPKSALGAGLGGAGMNSLGAGLGLTGPTSANAGGLIRAVTADVGTAPSVGALSVPQGWATTTPAIRLAATSLPAATGAAPLAGIGEGLLSPAALGSLTGGALGSPGSRLINGASVRGGAGRGREAPVQLDKVIAQLQQQKDSVQHWQIDEAGLDDLLEELAKKPGFHAVHLKKGAKGEPAASKSG